MIEMSHTDEDLKDDGLFAGEDDKLPANDVSEKCHTALEILQNELMNCERDISLEKSVREQNERKFQCFGESKDISSEVTDNVPNEKFIRLDDGVVSGKNDIFSNDQYCELIEKVTRISNQCNGIEEDVVQKIVFEYAELNNINHGFDRTSRKTGDEWYQRFIRSYPQLNSVVKKPCNDTVQLGGTEQTNEIVDTFISDYKKSKQDATIYQSMEVDELENEKNSCVASEKDSTEVETSPCLNSSEGIVSVCLFNDTDIFNQNDSDHVLSENSSLAELVAGNNETITESKQTYSNDLGENASFGLIETPQSVENCGNEEFIGAVSSVNSNNSHLVNDYSGNDQNISNESDRESNGTLGNVAEMKNDDSYGALVDEANTSIREISLCLETPDIKSTEKASGSEIEIEMKNDDITATVDNACIESNDGKTSNGEDVTVSGKSTSDLKDDVTGNSEVPYPQNENMANNSIPPSVSTDAVADKTPPSVRSPSKRKDTDSPAGPEGQEDAKKPKIGKKRGPLSKRKKRSKYIYKLKSYTGSVLYFTSSTSVSFIKPMITLTKLDDNSYRNSDDTITTLPNEDAPLETNHIDDTEMLNADENVEDQMETEITNHTDEKEMLGANDGIQDQVEPETTNHTDEKEKLNADDDSNDQVEPETTNHTDEKEKLNADDDSNDQVEPETTNRTGEKERLNADDDLKDQIETETTNSTDENVILNTVDDLKDPVETETNSISHDELRSQVEEDTNSRANVEFEHQGETETNSCAEVELKDPVEVETNPCADVELTSPVETDVNSCTDVDMKDRDETETNLDDDVQMEDQDQAETNSCFDVEMKDEDQTESNSCGDLLSTERTLTETNPCADVELKKEYETESSSSADVGLKDQVEAEINSRADADSNDHTEMETSSNFDNDLKNQDEAESNVSSKSPLLGEQIKTEIDSSLNDDESKDPVIPKTESNDQVVDDTNSNNDNDSNKEVANSTEMTKEKNTSRRTNSEGATPRTKTNTSNEKITPTFSMQTRRKRLKFLPDGTLVTPNQRHPHFSEEYTSSSRSEPKTSRKRPMKSSPQDTPRPAEKKMKMASTPSPATPKQPNRPTVSVKKEPKSRPDRYIPKPNGQSKKPQKLFDYDSFYRENFRQTEVQLPSSCKKQMVALSKVTSISPGAQSGGQITVNPSQLLSCLLGMPITPDQIRTVRFKPPGKQLKLNKPSNITPSKSAIDDSTKPLAKRHSELLQKIPKTETGVAKSAGNTKVHQTTQ